MDDIFTFGAPKTQWQVGGQVRSGRVREIEGRERGERQTYRDIERQKYRDIETEITIKIPSKAEQPNQQMIQLDDEVIKGQVSSGQVVLGQDRLRETFSTF